MEIKSCENDSNCVTVRDPSPGHYPMGLGRSLDLRWMEKMAGGKGEPNDGTVYSNALRTRFARKHLIKVSIRVWWPYYYRMFCVWMIMEVTGMDVAMFLSASCTLGLYCEASEHAQDHFHPLTDQAVSPIWWHRLVSGRCEGASLRNIIPVSRSSTLCSQSPCHSLVDVSHLASLAKARCKHIEQFIDVAYMMAMSDGNPVNLSGASGPPPLEQKALIAVGQVAMATDHGGGKTMLTGGEGFPIGGQPLGKREEAAMETWTSAHCTGRLQGSATRVRGDKTGVRLSTLIAAQCTTLSTAGCSTAQGGMNLAVSLVHPCPQEPKQVVEGHGGLFEGREL